MARPKKNKEVETAVETPVEESTLQVLQKRMEMLERALLEKAAEAEALRVAGASTYGGQRVVLQNTGYTDLCIPIEGEGTLVLEGRGPRSSGSVPLHVYARIKRELGWFEMGYVKVMGEVNDNPNIIDDAAGWVANTIEDRVVIELEKITSEGALNRLWTHVEALKNPTAKELLIKHTIQKRFETLFDVTLVEDSAAPGA